MVAWAQVVVGEREEHDLSGRPGAGGRRGARAPPKSMGRMAGDGDHAPRDLRARLWNTCARWPNPCGWRLYFCIPDTASAQRSLSKGGSVSAALETDARTL